MHQVAEEEKNTKMVIREGREDDVFKYTFKNCFDNDDDRYDNVDVGDEQEDEGDDDECYRSGDLSRYSNMINDNF